MEECDDFQNVGRLRSAQGLLTANLHCDLGELAIIQSHSASNVLAEVIGFNGGRAQLMPLEPFDQLRSGAMVQGLGRRFAVPVGDRLLGRVIDGLGRPIDGRGPLVGHSRAPVGGPSPAPLERPRIDQPLVTGQRVIDGFLTCGLGQRMALLAGSGVGKSTLLGEIAKGSSADINVVALVGERGREVKPFLDDCLGPAGISRSVTVVATADQPPLQRVRAAEGAVAVADYFRQRGYHVLLMLDSITRLAVAQREVGLLLGEPPSARGYTPSVFQKLATLLERLGMSESGSVTGILTVLVDGDDLDEPVTDAVRATVDGHIVLDRRLAQLGHFPAVDISRSLSRVFRDLTDVPHQAAAQKLRTVLATYDEVVDLIRIGAYAAGSSPQVDMAIQMKPALDALVRQDIGDRTSWEDTRRAMFQIAQRWPY